ncbi:MAG TPA: hypothetical protein VLD61_03560 [Methylomirabilota bacterium]|nr:hypothetical protein [Methylomirabilota bacterium]
MRRRVRGFLAGAAIIAALVLLAPAVIVVLPFWVVGFLTAWLARRLEPPATPWTSLVAFEPEVGWKPRPGLDTHYAVDGEDIFRLVTDPDGWPGATRLETSEIVVLGDSFAFGFGCDAPVTFFGLATGRRIKPIAAPGYNMVQELLWMERLAPALRDRLVVWFVYYGNDLYDNLTPHVGPYRAPFVRERADRDRWEVVTAHVSPRRWTSSVGRRRLHSRVLAALHSPTPLATRALAASDFLLAEGATICRRAGAQLAILTIPSPETLSPAGLRRLAASQPDGPPLDLELPDARVSATCRRLSLPLVVGRRVFGLEHFRADGHWNPAGHRRVAALLDDLHAQVRRTAPVPATQGSLG